MSFEKEMQARIHQVLEANVAPAVLDTVTKEVAAAVMDEVSDRVSACLSDVMDSVNALTDALITSPSPKATKKASRKKAPRKEAFHKEAPGGPAQSQDGEDAPRKKFTKAEVQAAKAAPIVEVGIDPFEVEDQVKVEVEEPAILEDDDLFGPGDA